MNLLIKKVQNATFDFFETFQEFWIQKPWWKVWGSDNKITTTFILYELWPCDMLSYVPKISKNTWPINLTYYKVRYCWIEMSASNSDESFNFEFSILFLGNPKSLFCLLRTWRKNWTFHLAVFVGVHSQHLSKKHAGSRALFSIHLKCCLSESRTELKLVGSICHAHFLKKSSKIHKNGLIILFFASLNAEFKGL